MATIKAGELEERTTAMADAAAQTERQTGQREAYCPHCFLLVETGVEGAWPTAPTRCRHCRLMIGPGRARPTAEASPGARGTAAGVFAQQAKNADEGGEHASAEAVEEAIRTVATRLGFQPERLLMVDYQQEAASDDSLPTLTDVFACFGSWKHARREAAASR
jgi:hypothetical protein